MRLTLAALGFMTTLGAGQAQDLTRFEPVLFPVLSRGEIRGVHGTSFQTWLVAHAQQPITYFPATDDGTIAVGEMPPGTERVNFYEATPRSAGRLLYLSTSDADKVKFFYQLSIIGPDSSTHEATLPVAREQDFLKGSSTIVGLRTGPLYLRGVTPPKVVGFRRRNYLRIYDVDNTGNLAAKVRVTVSALPAFVFAEFDVNVVERDADGPSYPYYTTIALPDLCITAPTGVTCRDFPLQVSIDPHDPNTRYYAFASATDNASGETSIWFPQ